MSEYQYYEFQTIDRLLNSAEQAEVAGLSSHIAVTAGRAVVSYSYGGGFRHDLQQVLSRYFDAGLYIANWGSRRLLFRFPTGSLEQAAVAPYCRKGLLELVKVGAHLILDIELDEERGLGWVDEPDDTLSALISLRDVILEGDYRSLYLVWLKAVAADSSAAVADEQEPPVPAGLRKLTPALQRLAQFFDIAPDLIESAATLSPTEAAALPDQALRQAIARLPRADSDELLWRLAKGEARLGPILKQRLRGLLEASPVPVAARRRSVRQLRQTADELRLQAEMRRREVAETQRVAGLKKLAKREALAWQSVETLLQQGQARAYDEAVSLLSQLRELAEFQQTQPEFKQRLSALRVRYHSRHSLLKRLDQAGLL